MEAARSNNKIKYSFKYFKHMLLNGTYFKVYSPEYNSRVKKKEYVEFLKREKKFNEEFERYKELSYT